MVGTAMTEDSAEEPTGDTIDEPDVEIFEGGDGLIDESDGSIMSEEPVECHSPSSL